MLRQDCAPEPIMSILSKQSIVNSPWSIVRRNNHGHNSLFAMDDGLWTLRLLRPRPAGVTRACGLLNYATLSRRSTSRWQDVINRRGLHVLEESTNLVMCPDHHKFDQVACPTNDRPVNNPRSNFPEFPREPFQAKPGRDIACLEARNHSFDSRFDTRFSWGIKPPEASLKAWEASISHYNVRRCLRNASAEWKVLPPRAFASFAN